MSVRSLQPTRWLAQRLGVSVSTIERLRARGERNLPPHVVIGPQSVRYDEAVVEAWLSQRMQVSGGDRLVVPETRSVASLTPTPEVLRRRIANGRAASAVGRSV